MQVAVELFWKWDGHAGDIQPNEYFTAKIGPKSISCRDFADQNVALANAKCGETGRFDQSGDLKISLTHGDDGNCVGGSSNRPPRPGECVSPGSISAVVTVIWYFEEPPKLEPPQLTATVDCTGATFSGMTSTPMALEYALSDGQSGVLDVEGSFTENIAWQPSIVGQYGPHSLSAAATLMIDLAEAVASETDLTCGEAPAGELTVTIDCTGATFQGATAPFTSLRYTLGDGQSGVVNVAGSFSETIPWQPSIQGLFGPHTLSASADLLLEGAVLASIADAGEMNCGEAPAGELTVTIDCTGATFQGAAAPFTSLSYTLGDGQSGAVNVAGSFSETIPWQPSIQGLFGPHTVSADADLIFEGAVLASIADAGELTCGEPEVRVSITCEGATFEGLADLSLDLNYTLSDGQSDTVSVSGNFSEFIPWQREVQETFGPQLLVARGHMQSQSRTFKQVLADGEFTCQEREAAICRLIETTDKQGRKHYEPAAFDPANDKPVQIADWRIDDSNFDVNLERTLSGPKGLPIRIIYPKKAGDYWVSFEVNVNDAWYGGDTCQLGQEVAVKQHCSGHCQSQGKVGPVALGNFTPKLEPGKDYFDLTRSIMFNTEYLNQTGQGELVFRFNGQEMSDVTSSIFNDGEFRQVNDGNTRTTAQLDDGVTKLIVYRHGQEQGRVFQTKSTDPMRWIKPLDQPFEHKHAFQLELHGPPLGLDLLVYQDHSATVQYDANGVAVVNLDYSAPGIVGVYQTTDEASIANWTTVAQLQPAEGAFSYQFTEIGLNHYRIVDQAGQVVAGPSLNPALTFQGESGAAYWAQLAYPETSLYVAVYDYMEFEHPDHWTMPIDPHNIQYHEFLVDYHREDGQVVIDGLSLNNATVSVAQQFPYGRHDAIKVGVNIFGIPNVSMVAFCQRPGYHEVAFWGGWENESYYLPDRATVVDADSAQTWSEHQSRDCADAALRINMALARQGLRTDHTFRHHGEKSQGYQMAMQKIWSPYNLAGMYPPHVAQILKPGTVLPYYHTPEDLLFWGWDLEKGSLTDGLGQAELQQYIDALGPAVYNDQTGLHPVALFNQ